jgi:16S rRNA A1518/A1519 N6-dimethyltransferase RsmA/KsgA/DIM1 with predicted DNA glycosylase/AP lyase activity
VAVRRRPARDAPGQHFLRSSRLAAELVRDAGVEAGELVVEIGAGTGVLTRALAETGARVIALELDPMLAFDLRQRLSPLHGVSVFEADALAWDWPTPLQSSRICRSQTRERSSPICFAIPGAVCGRRT